MDTALVKYRLREYVCRELIRDDFREELLYIDEDVQISTMRISDMPRSSAPMRRSTVEDQAILREDSRSRVYADIAEFDKACEQMAKALMTLSDLEYTVVTNLFLTLDYDDVELAESLAMSVSEVQKIRNQALFKLYERLNTETRRRQPKRGRVAVEPVAVSNT